MARRAGREGEGRGGREPRSDRAAPLSDEDFGVLSASRWLYALEAARCAAYALDESKPAKEAPLAALCALEAVRDDATKIADAEITSVAESIRSAISNWLDGIER